jgi:acyl transferase domain-containing protein/NADPH:quinone reductase-like Zn-dependent oxidoreductase/short-subunit dehydrogenase/ubiquinone/menaquinone biosynthesis C-methylase UbiE/acyl carrier protein
MVERDAASRHEPIAITGIGCRFPGGAATPSAFWQLLRNGVDAISEVPPDRWDLRAYYDPDPKKPGKMNTRWGGFLQNIDKFDALFFGISPREAALMDPQQRLLLEIAWEALEHAGQPAGGLAGTDTGVFIGISSHDYGDLQMGDHDGVDRDHYMMTGAALSIAANRLSYFFDLRGPSFAVDTACSSALVATHLACRSLWNGECSMALAGGVNIVLSPIASIGFSKASMLSPNGRCKAFDSRADGYVRSEGAGIVVLKPLSRALADADPIIATILGSASNQDGHTPGITVPNQAAQSALLREAYRHAGVAPAAVQYVEAHGTGTAVGDPIEAAALGAVLSECRPAGSYCWIGSVKTNIGHLEAGSGIAGLIKVALALKHGEIPRNLHFDQPNPKIPFDELKLRVPEKREPWPANGEGAIAGVNSFGFGGANAHVVVGSAPAHIEASIRTEHADREESYLLPLSARSPESLKATLEGFRAFADQGGTWSLHDLCYTAGARRHHHDFRQALIVQSREELVEQLETLLARPSMPAAGNILAGRKSKLAFVFSGMGPQWWGMGRQLLAQEPVFRDAVHACDDILRPLAGWSLLAELTADERASRMSEAHIAQPASFALQVALARVWRSWGVEPDFIVGHSAGECAAAHVAGALSLEDAVRVIFHRSRLQQRQSGRGKMLAVGLPVAQARQAIAGEQGRVSIAAINSGRSITLAGDTDALEKIALSLQQERVFCRFLNVAVPYHSHHMDDLRSELLESLASIRPLSPSIPIYSTVDGAATNSAFDAAYWWRNVRDTVLFAPAIERLVDEGCENFVELSAHPVLTSTIAENLSGRGDQTGKILPSLRRGETERATMLASLGALYTIGVPFRWAGLYPEGGRCIELPTYPWQREVHWTEADDVRSARIRRYQHPLLGRAVGGAQRSWQSTLDRSRLPYLNDHRIQGGVVYPGAAYAEMALAAGRHLFGGNAICEELEFRRALFLPGDTAPRLQFTFDEREATFNIYSTSSQKSEGWSHHATGKLRAGREDAQPNPLALERIRSRCTRKLSKTECYLKLRRMGLQYGPCHQGIEEIWLGDDEALGDIRVPDAIFEEAADYNLHPAVLDSAFQVLIGAMLSRATPGEDGLYLPVGIERISVYGRPGRRLWSHARISKAGPNGLDGTITLVDEAGLVIAEVQALRCWRVQGSRADTIGQQLYEFQWYPKALDGGAAIAKHSDFFSPLDDVVADVRTKLARFSDASDRDQYYAIVEPRLDALSLAYMIEALRQLGFEFKPGELTSAAAMKARLAIAPQHDRLLHRIIEMMEQRGIIRKQAAEIVVVDGRRANDCEAMRRSLLENHPEYGIEIELIGRCGAALADVLRGECDPLQLIYPRGNFGEAERFYREAASFATYNRLATAAVMSALRAMPHDRPVRILEIGAGTGGLTSHILSALPANRIEYVFTDVSSAFMSAAEQKFTAYPFVQYRQLDIEQDPRDQGFKSHSFDLILASDVLHATKSVRVALENVKTLLNSSGLIVLIELENTPLWAELIFGLLKGWWLFTDTDIRPARPWLSHQAWRGVLARQGFVNVAGISDRAGGEPLHCVTLARGPRFDVGVVRQPGTLPHPEARGSWLILADQGGLGRDLADRLRRNGQAVALIYAGAGARTLEEDAFEVDPENDAALVAVLTAAVAKTHAACRGVVHLWSLDAPPSENASVGELAAAQKLGSESIINLVQAVSKQPDWKAPPRFWLVTRGAQGIDSDDAPASVTHSLLWGVGSVLAQEMGDFRCSMIDLDAIRAADEAEVLFRELITDDAEAAIASRAGTRYVRRLVRIAQQSLHDDETRESKGQNFRLEALRPGVLDSLAARETPECEPGSGEIAIRVKAAGLNFRDVMKALGIYPTDGDDPLWLGDECSGTVVALGADVEDFAVGDDVVCIAAGCFGAFATTPAAFATRKPPHLSFAEAATVPIAFLTSYYALNRLAGIAPGERILIHAAAGGVGLAAIQIAQRVGAEIFATAGNQEKREFLKSLGVQHVMDSRSLDFADEVMSITHGEGIDIVLNSLAGDAIAKSLSLLRQYGRFIEIGKRDIYQNSKLGMRPFKNNISFFAVDLAMAFRSRAALVGAMLRDVMRLLEEKALNPLPLRVYPIHEVVAAFRHMSQARHIGKIVISLEDSEPLAIVPLARNEPLVHPHASYLVTGGCGGFGLAVAEWLVEQGARHLVLVGRRGIVTPEAEATVERMKQAGCEVAIRKVDVVHHEEMAALFADTIDTMPPLRGVIHAAMVLDDGAILQLTPQRMRTVVAPKMNGAWNLHRLTLDRPLDFFVMFSSFTSLVGNPGQANYVAANTFLDALAHYRRGRGLPALAVNWGALADVGYVSRHGELSQYLERFGIGAMPVEQATAILGVLLRANRAQAGAAQIDWRRIRESLPHIEAASQFGHLVRGDTQDVGAQKQQPGTFRSLLQAAPAGERATLLNRMLSEWIAAVIGAPVSKLNLELPIADLGVDSLMAVELETVIKSELSMELPAGLLLERRVTVAELGSQLLEALAIETADDPHITTMAAE